MSSIVNRVLGRMFPDHFSGFKHNHYADFGYPVHLEFEDFKRMYDRNGFATAAVDRTVLKCWEDVPAVWVNETSGGDSKVELAIKERFKRLRVWQKLATADTRALVGGYSGVVLRLADGKGMDQPVDRVPRGLDGLVELIPAWGNQLTVSKWDEDIESDTYGKPLMFQFQEVSSGNRSSIARNVNIHPDRVLLWSEDGTLDCESLLKSGYNNLLDLEKISGAGGEGFWKNAKASPVLEVDKEANFTKMASAMGIKESEIKQKMSDQVEDWQKGLDNVLMLQGIKATPLPITLSSPEHTFLTSLQMFSASITMPMKILTGNQNGERASSEDADEWAKTCKSRRSMIIMPLLVDLIDRLVSFGVLTPQPWHLEWSDLTESSVEKKMATSKTMAEVNSITAPTGELVFLPQEIRQAAGYPSETDMDLSTDEGDDNVDEE